MLSSTVQLREGAHAVLNSPLQQPLRLRLAHALDQQKVLREQKGGWYHLQAPFCTNPMLFGGRAPLNLTTNIRWTFATYLLASHCIHNPWGGFKERNETAKLNDDDAHVFPEAGAGRFKRHSLAVNRLVGSFNGGERMGPDRQGPDFVFTSLQQAFAPDHTLTQPLSQWL
jgi:hypothetical protein